MWYNPRYPRPEQPQPPTDTGTRLATLSRENGSEMRITLTRMDRRPFVAFRVWEPGSDGQLWPVKGKGCSVRLHEVGEAIAALRQVEDLVDRG